MNEAQVIAEIDSAGGWDGLAEAFRRAVALRNTTYEAVSEVAGLPARYVNKITGAGSQRRGELNTDRLRPL
jgi:hypothetical protein